MTYKRSITENIYIENVRDFFYPM